MFAFVSTLDLVVRSQGTFEFEYKKEVGGRDDCTIW